MGLLEWWYAPDAQEREDKLDKQIAELNRRSLERGEWSQEQYDAAEMRRVGGAINVERELDEAFDEGIEDGKSNIKNTIGGAVNSVVKLPFEILPASVFVIAGLVAFVYMGGLSMLKGALLKK